eukprot:scaffold2.g7450.t1
MGFLGINFNLREQLAFYGSYHNKPLNQLIHFLFVPVILGSVAVWLAYTPPLFSWPSLAALPPALAPLARLLVPNGAFMMLAAYSAYYLALEPAAGLSWAVAIAAPLWAGANAMRGGVPNAWAWALGAHVLGWFMQIVPGHSWVEGRKPALLDSFFQSLVLAPLFVWFEALFLAGYRPGLRREIGAVIDANIAEWRKAQAAAVGSPRAPLLGQGGGAEAGKEK